MGKHLFISYATEDSDLAEWLSLKLTSEDYAVWCDRFELLGGESYPRDIDLAIKEKTFRVLALLSKNSIDKPDPRKERTLALNIAHERDISDFLIPLNVDGLRATELDWMMSDITFIPFSNSWADGFSRLLKKLVSIEAPRDVKNGREIVANIYLNHMTVEDKPETLYSNCIRFTQIPDEIVEYHFTQSLSRYEMNILSDRWAFYYKDSNTAFAFTPPPDARLFEWKEVRRHCWQEVADISGIASLSIVKNLLKRSLEVKMLQKGLRRAESRKIYFSFGLFDRDKLHFTGYTGRKTYVMVAGERHYPKDFKYHISPSFGIKEFGEDFIAEVSINLHLTDSLGEQLESRTVHSRHKAIRNNWWNNHYLNRCLAVCEYLAEEDGNIVIGEGENAIVLDQNLICFDAPFGIDEEELQGLPDDEKDDEIELLDELEEVTDKEGK